MWVCSSGDTSGLETEILKVLAYRWYEDMEMDETALATWVEREVGLGQRLEEPPTFKG